jgi:hypothetical protein
MAFISRINNPKTRNKDMPFLVSLLEYILLEPSLSKYK